MISTIFPLITNNDLSLPFFVNGIGVQHNQEYINRPQGFPSYHMAYCARGQGKLFINKNSWIIGKDTGFLLYPDIPHKYYAIMEPWEIRWLTFEGSHASEVLKLLDIKESQVLKLNDIKILDFIMEEICRTYRIQSQYRSIECSSLLYTFLVRLKMCTNTATSLSNNKHNQLQPVLTYLEDNYNKNISLSDISSVINVSSNHLCRLFKHTLNMTPFSYITKLRIKKAKELLIEFPDLPVQIIGKKAGYNDSSYFGSVFKEQEGVTPVEFRRIHGIV